MPPPRYVIADKGYDSAPLRQWLDQLGCQAVIPPRRNRKVLYRYDANLYKERNIIERTINRFKDWRRIATRFDRYAFVFLAALSIAAVVTWWVSRVRTLLAPYASFRASQLSTSGTHQGLPP